MLNTIIECVIHEKSGIQKATCILLLLLLAACQTKPVVEDLAQTNAIKQAQHQQKLAAFDHWHSAGKLLLRQDEVQYLLLFDWQQRTHGMVSLRLDSQFGSTLLKVDKKLGGYKVQLSGKAPLVTQNLDQLIQRELRVNLSYQALAYWIKGMVYPDYPIDEAVFNADGYLDKLIQAGWQVEYQAYTDQTPEAGLVLPYKIKLMHNQQTISLFIRWL